MFPTSVFPRVTKLVLSGSAGQSCLDEAIHVGQSPELRLRLRLTSIVNCLNVTTRAGPGAVQRAK